MGFQIGTQEAMNVPIWIIVRFQQQNRQDSHNLNNDSICKIRVSSCQYNIGSKKYPDAAILSTYNVNDFSQGWGQIKKVLRALTKDDIFRPYISEHDYRSSNDSKNFGFSYMSSI